ncbi:hypothetical protein PHLCEN_2v2438 [Hermanssonia centrifuga]|uniref:Uncharacterized protein n=1 Tax=Hermanssonia centrifuga TaxID=98765 RepID=A0A2R6RM23_9APHY|nr:hypothetical protein PHLCEN_2v2438 [Hermanssonia centrifuga]
MSEKEIKNQANTSPPGQQKDHPDPPTTSEDGAGLHDLRSGLACKVIQGGLSCIGDDRRGKDGRTVRLVAASVIQMRMTFDLDVRCLLKSDPNL